MDANMWEGQGPKGLSCANLSEDLCSFCMSCVGNTSTGVSADGFPEGMYVPVHVYVNMHVCVHVCIHRPVCRSLCTRAAQVLGPEAVAACDLSCDWIWRKEYLGF